MGTRADSRSEWIELYYPNLPGSLPLNLTGWKLVTVSGPLDVKLEGVIKPGGYYLLGRRTFPGDNDGPFKKGDPFVDQLYDGAQMSDSGETLALYDASGKVVDTANSFGSAWPAGTNYPILCSMERARGNPPPDSVGYWLTNAWSLDINDHNGHDQQGNSICGTPRRPNWAWKVTPTPTLTVRPTSTSYCYYCTRTITPTPKKSLTPTRNPNATPVSNVVINEFLPQPRADWNGDGQVDSGDEFIEIINLGIQSVSLTNWVLDDQPGDSTPFIIGNVSIEPGARLAFFSSETGILLSTGGDTVRLFRPGGQVSDAFTYGVIRNPDQSWCRLPDGKNNWVFGCAPSVTEANHLAQSVIVGNRVESGICLSKTLPLGVLLAECDSVGLSAWDSALWDTLPGFPRFFDAGRDVYILD